MPVHNPSSEVVRVNNMRIVDAVNQLIFIVA